MSTFRVPTVQIGKVGKHPNADSLSITTVEGGPCIFRTGDFKEGDIAIYVPVDAVVPETVPGTEFLGKHRRIKAVRLRGIFSMGLLLPYAALRSPTGILFDDEPTLPNPVGRDVAAYLGITKYEEPEPLWMKTEQAPPPKLITQAPVFDVESFRKYKSALIPDEEVVVTEKLHGTNSRFVFKDGALHVGSHRTWKKYDERNIWWRIAEKYKLKEKVARYPGLIVYGETYGANVQDFSYNLKEPGFAIFDMYNSNAGHWLDWDEVVAVADILDIPIVPILYQGPYSEEEVAKLEKGESTVSGWKMREGVVVKPTRERWNNQIGRVILKLVSEDYLTRKGGTEHH